MATSPPVTVRAVACALTLTPSSRLSRASFRNCLAQRRRRRWPPRCSGKQAAVVEEETASSREAKSGEGDEGRGVQGWFALDTIGLDILSIALPAALALAADPIAALVDTAFVGHLGSAELAAVGVSISVFNLVSKLFNVPLLNVTTSFVAEQQATDDGYTGTREGYDFPRSPEEVTTKRKFLPAVSTSLALAAGIGLLETVVLIFGSGTLMDMIAVPTALLASEYAKGNYKQARLVLYRVLQIGGVTGVALAVVLFFGFGSFSVLFTSDPAGLDIAKSGVWFVTVSQPINAIAFVIDGLYYGVSDFTYAAYSMFFVGAVSSAFLLAAAPKLGLCGVWSGLVREQRWTMEAHLVREQRWTLGVYLVR
ncbi:unnamed protein product [Miscanthus lutarioriparius]|uniref:Protein DETOXIFICATION n=1 Tax=Miscanthus lutarioriparius TaxID=422564 RepID=A0A811Q421_9POAL|nr:unnamed protein product [Miscanthus lutarioriparius]